MTESSSLNLTIKRRSNKKAGFEVEKQEDGFYYISKVPKNCKKISVGDRVLEINGTMHSDFKSQANANDLVDSFRLEVVPIDDNDEVGVESDEEYEEVDRSGSKSRDNFLTPIESEEVDYSGKSENLGSHGEVNEDDNDYGDDSSDGGEIENEEPDWDDEDFDNDNSNSSSGRMAPSRRGIVPSESWERPYVSQYKPNDRFMISVTKEEDNDDLGIDLVEYQENEIYVSEVNQGPFYETALNRGDRIISVNGKKVSNDLHSVGDVMDLIKAKSKLTIFVLRPLEDDGGYNWVLESNYS